MAKTFSNKKTVTIHAPVTDLWQALTDPEMIKHYFFGVETTGKWNEGNTIVYKGEWQGKKFEGKGKVLQIETQKLLRHSYWSKLTPENGSTKLTLTEENLTTKESKESSAKLWDMVFDSLKKLLERQAVI